MALLVAGSLAVWGWTWAAHVDWPASLQAAWALPTALIVLLAYAQRVWRANAHAPWTLRFDGHTWHWFSQTTRGACRQGQGRVTVALCLGPWTLLRAQAAKGSRAAASSGHDAWIWLRPQGLGAAGRRLRSLLDWA